MKLVAILLVSIVGMVSSASLGTKPQCSFCQTAVNWARSNENVLNAIQFDDETSNDVVELLESDRSAKDVCGLLAMCETSDDTKEYLTNLPRRACICIRGRCVCHIKH